jgi:hypothetical protein
MSDSCTERPNDWLMPRLHQAPAYSQCPLVLSGMAIYAGHIATNFVLSVVELKRVLSFS